MIAAGTIKGLLLIESLSVHKLIEQYRLFFLGLLPGIFILAVLFEFLGDLAPFSLIKRAFIAILILTSISSFYYQSIDASIGSAESILEEAKSSNILLMDMLDSGNYLDSLNTKEAGKDFFKDESVISGIYSFIKYHLFAGFVNDGLTVGIFLIAKICFLILKVVYSIVYYLGYGLIGIPCILYLFSGMGGVLKGAITSFVWCLIVPHVLVFILTIIGGEINRGYMSGAVIGGSIMGTALLLILTLFIAFTPLIASMILSGSGVGAAGGIIATMGANYVMSLPKTALNLGATKLSGGKLGDTGPKMKLATMAAKGTYRFAKNSFTQGHAAMGGRRDKSQNSGGKGADVNAGVGARATDRGNASRGPFGGPNNSTGSSSSGNQSKSSSAQNSTQDVSNNSRKSTGAGTGTRPTPSKTSFTRSGNHTRDEQKFPRSPSQSQNTNQSNNRGNYGRTVQRHGESNPGPKVANNLDRTHRHRPASPPSFRRRHDSPKA